MNSLPPDPYDVLGVARDAALPDIRSAHRKLVLKCHPDKVQDPALKAEKQDEFQRVQQAYELLSDEKQRFKYDEQYKLMELRKEFQKKMANTSSPRTPPRHFNVDIRTAEPRSTSFSGGPVPPSKMYSQKYPARSYEDEIHSSGRSALFEELNGRSARRTASYDEKPVRRDDDRERERDRERRRRKEEEEIREQERRLAEKELRRAEKKRAEKAREKERRRDGDSKRSRHSPYVEEYVDEEAYAIPRVEKKSTTKKHDEKYRDDIVTDATAAKVNDTMLQAASYLASSRAKVAGRDPFGFMPAVPTPPPAPSGPFPAPVVEDDDAIHRSRAAPRRASDTPRSSKEKSSHKKSNSGPMEAPDSPLIFDASPTTRHAPQFKSSTTTPPQMSEPRPGELPRANTMHPGEFGRAVPMPSIRRSETYHPGMDPDPRGRSRSRFSPQVEIEEFSEGEVDARPREREQHRSKHRSSRHKTRSPSPPSREEYVRAIPQHTRYAVNHEGRTVPVDAFFDDAPRSRKHGGSSKQPTYYSLPKSGHSPRVVEVRPSGPPREATWSGGSGGSYSSGGHFPKFKTAKNYDEADIHYSGVPRSGFRDEYTAAWA